MRPLQAWTALLALAATLAGCGAATLPAVHSDAERLALARRMAARGDAASAIELLKTYVANSGGAADVDQAVYLLGQCYLRTREHAEAQLEFERLLREYPESDSSASASFRLGEALMGQARPADFDQEYVQKALAQWQSYLATYPGHWLNAEAGRHVLECRTRLAGKLLRTGDLYLKLKLPAPARFYFARVTEEYADTTPAGEAELGLARCDVMQGKRSEAIARLKELEARFAGQPLAARAAHERARLERS